MALNPAVMAAIRSLPDTDLMAIRVMVNALVITRGIGTVAPVVAPPAPPTASGRQWRRGEFGMFFARGRYVRFKVEKINDKSLGGRECDEFGNPSGGKWRVSPSYLTAWTPKAFVLPRWADSDLPHHLTANWNALPSPAYRSASVPNQRVGGRAAR